MHRCLNNTYLFKGEQGTASASLHSDMVLRRLITCGTVRVIVESYRLFGSNVVITSVLLQRGYKEDWCYNVVLRWL